MSSLNVPDFEQLRISDLHAFYGESHILHGIDMQVRRGELVTLLGRNGAGRSTTLRAIMNMVGRRTGSIMSMATKPSASPLT
jgi:branched-chain amino acid transport system ATP-binding protein